jgi:hyperosmotically inducible protein
MRMIRALLILVVLGVGAFVLMGYWTGAPSTGRIVADRPAPAPAVGTGGAIDVDKARDRGAQLGEKAAIAAEKVKDTAHDATITTKIKAKMALDDSIKARAIDVSTDGSTVTLEGTVGSVAQHDRALALARETTGVTQVIDRLKVHAR